MFALLLFFVVVNIRNSIYFLPSEQLVSTTSSSVSAWSWSSFIKIEEKLHLFLILFKKKIENKRKEEKKKKVFVWFRGGKNESFGS